MKNITWRRTAIILSIILAGVICFGVGYAMGATDTAKWIFNQGLKILEMKGMHIDITRTELLEYYIKLKGGM